MLSRDVIYRRWLAPIQILSNNGRLNLGSARIFRLKSRTGDVGGTMDQKIFFVHGGTNQDNFKSLWQKQVQLYFLRANIVSGTVRLSRTIQPA